MNENECVAGVLIGGESRRMGACKALATFGGTSFAERAAAAAAQVADEVVLLGNVDVPMERLQGFARLPDAPFGHGPLRGLHPLLEHAGRRWALLLACDMPMLNPDLLRRLLNARTKGADAVAFLGRDQRFTYHACCAAYHPRVLPVVREELAAGLCKIQSVLRLVRCTGLIPTADEEERLVNINTPETLAELNAKCAVR